MKILLIQTPYERLKGFMTNEFPLNLGQLATCLEGAGHYARIYNADRMPVKNTAHKKYSEKNRSTSQSEFIRGLRDENNSIWAEVRNTVQHFQPDMVGITCMTSTFPVALKIANIVKSISQSLPVVMGGCHPTVMPFDVAKREEVDFVIQGEGEFPLIQLCNYLDKRDSTELGDIPGLFYKDNGQIIQCKENTFIEDINELPLIRRDLILFPEIYNSESYSKVMSSRGCPYGCTFCSSPAIWKRKVRFRKPDKIIEEIHYLKKELGVQRFGFWDDTFTSSKKYVVEFCELLLKNDLNINWRSFVRANTVDKELLRTMRKAGCYLLSMGIESGSDRVLKRMNKGITVDMVRKAVKRIKEEGFILGSFWMMGIPYETEEDMMKTVGLMQELDVDHINFCTFVPEPMTELYDVCIKEGTLDKNIDWATTLDVGHHSTENYFNKNVPKNRYDEILKKALEVVESRNKRTLKKKLKAFWIQRNYFLKPRVIYERAKDYL